MEILPIKLLRDEDALLFGQLNVCLGKLARLGFPVVEGHVSSFPNGQPELEIFIKNPTAAGRAFYDPLLEDVSIDIKSGKPHPKDLKKIVELVNSANKKLFMPYVYEWLLDTDVKLSGLLPYTPVITSTSMPANVEREFAPNSNKTTIKVFLDLSEGLAIEKGLDGVFIDSEKVSDFDELTFKLVEAANTFPAVLLKLSSNLTGIDPLDFARHKKGLNNIHIVIPAVHTTAELTHIKRELAARKLMRKHSLGFWLEVSYPENILNLEEYLEVGVDGVVLNLDQLISYINGLDPQQEELGSYKKESAALLKILEDSLRLLHKSSIPFIAFGEVSLYPEVLDFLVEKGVHGIIAERYDAHSMVDLLNMSEKRMILRRSI